MTIAVLLPVKPIHLAKSRLSAVMNDEARERWVREEFIHTLDVLREVAAIDHVLVISSDPEVWQIAKAHQVEVLEESDVPGLNQSVQRGIAWCQAQSVDTVMILPIDLPLLKPYCVRASLARLVEAPGMVIVPDRHRYGTNLLVFTPNDLIPPLYGENSFKRHLNAAREAGVTPTIYRCQDLSIDVDTPDDLVLVMH
ncbi:MAG: 2-phospho-L-lactate guanylyltransferase [Anaerolineae bacterium]|jgi:2-phospho-L-lactate guanylyltransferase|nr:2-phospho-L-lactate guanylyltransferase [Anaerolineae bacterium]